MLIACLWAARVAPALAGHFNFGCRGDDDGDTYIFDRIALVIPPNGLGRGDLTGLMKDYIDVHDHDDTDMSLQPVLKFRDGAFRARQLTSTEKSSSKEVGKVWTRDRIKTTMRTTYQLGPAVRR